MSAHTPGPWRLEPVSGDQVGIRVSGPIVSGYTAIITGPWCHADQRAEQVANANLIAAAPDLLAALERTLNWLASYPGEGPMGPKGPYNQARAAIAKATGEQT